MNNIKALLFRVDPSKTYLNTLKSQGYVTVVFVANIEADPECEYLNGNIYNIEELLILDNPLFRMSHPNCRCKFDGFGKGTQTEPKLTTTPSGPIPTAPETTSPTATPGANQTEEYIKEKNPWYKRWMPWLFKNKQKSNFRANILRRAYNAKKSKHS